jgi:GT2 family glycosyltransferase
MTALRLSICIVLYESVETTKRFHLQLCESLGESSQVELLYFDNSASDALQEWFAGRISDSIQYTRDSRNLGFAYGNNRLILNARYERVLLLNPDVFGLTKTFWDRIATIDAGGTARFARLLNEDGSFQDCIGEVASLERALKPRRDYGALEQPAEVGMGIMAFMLTDKHVFASVGLLDCSYPLYAEDMDWCFRARHNGVRVLYDPGLVLTHIGGASAKDRWKLAESNRKKYFAEAIFIDKHYRGWTWICMRALNAVKRRLRGR